MAINSIIEDSIKSGLQITIVLLDPFEEAKTYEFKGVALEINHEESRVKVQSSNEIFWVPLEEITEVIS